MDTQSTLPEADQTLARAERVLEEHGRCDVLVNNAAQLGLHTLEQLDLETFRRFERVNVEAPLLLCSRLLPAMAANGGGRVINIVSNTVWAPPGPGMTAYITSKGALLGMTRALAVEWGARNITVNAVAPGLTRTPATDADIPEQAFAAVRSQQALDHELNPADIAGAVGYLASDAAAAVTGQALRVDAGTGDAVSGRVQDRVIVVTGCRPRAGRGRGRSTRGRGRDGDRL